MSASSLGPGATGILIAVLAVGFPAGTSAQDDQNPFRASVDARAGQALFDRHCSRCHGIGGGGGETGPDLTTGRFRQARTDQGLFSLISRGIPNTMMPAFGETANDQQVWQIVAYLGSLSGGPRVEVSGDPDNGARIYADNTCSQCHMLAGRGGRQGPELTEVGDLRSPGDLLSDLLRPDERVLPAWWRMQVTHRDGTEVTGRRLNEGTFSVQILDEDDNLWSFLKRDLVESERIETSSMPSYRERLSDSELEDLVAFLYGLTKEGG